MDSSSEESPEQGFAGLRDLMRHRRPHLFSDTVRDSAPAIAREILDYQLESLTYRKQEYQFEHFARLLAERVICPNLVVQTGPTGGGDGKVDTETYPVAEEIAERWYGGETGAHGERWAFAFSAMQDWERKVRKDVASIAGTDRGYARIIFITSRYATARKSSAKQDQLTREFGIPVTIHDRGWILDQVYKNGWTALAVEALGLGAQRDTPVERLGPLDAARIRELEDLDARIGDPNRYRGANYSLAEDCLISALLARGLERDRTEVEGRFARARRIADKIGIAEQRCRILYLEAWTAHWWFEDRAKLIENYALIEPLIAGSLHCDEVDKLLTLWQLLAGGCRQGDLDAAEIELEAKRLRLVAEFERLAGDERRRNNALQAKFSLGIMAAHGALVGGDLEELDRIWAGLTLLVGEADHLISFPFDEIFSLVEDLGEFFPHSDEYERLLDAFTPMIAERRSNSAAGLAQARRGLQKLEKEQWEEAVRLLGLASTRLAKDEEIKAFIAVMVGLSTAYRALGLPWAARTSLLIAVDRSFAVMLAEGDIPASLLTALHDLMAVEIELGRLPQTLAAWKYLATMSDQFEMDDEDRTDLHRDFHLLARLLGHMMLNATVQQFASLERMPDELEAMGLPVAALMLLWGLGHEDIVRTRYLPPEGADSDIEKLFLDEREAPVIKSIRKPIVIGDEARLTLTSRVLGCEFRFDIPNEPDAIRIAEAAAGAFEAFLATSLNEEVYAYLEYLRFEVRLGASESFETLWHDYDAERWAELRIPERADYSSARAANAFSVWLWELVGETIGRVFHSRRVKAWLDQIAGNEEAHSRAITFGNVPILSSSVFDEAPCHRFDHWEDPDAERYPMQRKTTWLSAQVEEAKTVKPQVSRAEGERPPFFNTDHSKIRTSSIIDLPLWDKAGWQGTGTALFPRLPPVLALGFRNVAMGVRIFEGWRLRFGTTDESDLIRIAIIRGLKQKRPAEYAVTISRSFEDFERDEQTLFTTLTRLNRMTPDTTENLDTFLAAFEEVGAYVLVPMDISAPLSARSFRLDLGIMKRKLDLRSAWEIGTDDFDSLVFQNDDDPVVPTGIADPPSRAAIAKMREWREKRGKVAQGSTFR